jgi:cell division protease FtsH
MPTLAQLRLACKNAYLRAAAVVLIVIVSALAIYTNEVPQDPAPLLYSQDISKITALAAQKERIDYLLVARPAP